MPESQMKNRVPKRGWREHVTAEITVVHVVEFAREVGGNMSAEDAAAMLNQGEVAYDMWKHMMRAGEEYIKTVLSERRPALAQARQPRAHLVV